MMIDQFLKYLRCERNKSQLTVLGYERALRDFEAYFKELDSQLVWETVDADVIRGWMENMVDRGVMASSVNTYLSAVRSFFRFSLSRGFVVSDPAYRITGPKRTKPLPYFMREDEVDELLDKIEWGTSYVDVRARTILLLFYESGIRLSELIGLSDEDVDFGQRQLKVTGKRNKQRIVPFGEELEQALKQFMALRDEQVPKSSDALFLTPEGRRMNRGQVHYVVHKHLSRVTTMKKRSSHVLRHTFATAMLNHEAGLESVKKLLGHQSLNTTEVYTHTTFEQLKRVYKQAHPRA
jgi:integrase/recombinase XerC